MASKNDTNTIKRFREFYRDEYHDDIEEFAAKYPTEQRSLSLDWTHIDRYDSDLAETLISNPEQTLDSAAAALRMHGQVINEKFDDPRVKITKLGEMTPLSALRSQHLGTFIETAGRVTEVSPVTSELSEGAWKCDRCGALTRKTHTPIQGTQLPPNECTGCEQPGPFTLDHDQSEWVDHHAFRIEQRAQDETATTAVVKRVGDAPERVTAGDHVRVTGVLRREELGKSNGSSLPDKYIEPSAIVSKASAQGPDFSGPEEERMIELSEAPDVYEQVVDSVAPSIYGHREVKLAIILQLFSGVSKELPTGSRIAGDIHTLLIGDPGTAKSALGDAAERLSPNGGCLSATDEDRMDSAAIISDRSFDSHTALSSSSTVGTAAFADVDFLFIDDVDTLSNEMRGTLVDVLEERMRNKAKTRTVMGLPRRASVLCTARPRNGRFDPYEPISEQLVLDPELISQFDLIFPISDRPGDDADRNVAEHIVKTHFAGEHLADRSSHSGSHDGQTDTHDVTEAVTPPIEADLLRKYITFATHNCSPRLTDEAMDALCEFYIGLRQKGRFEDAPVPVTAKQLGTLVRLAEASARVRLSEQVTTEDTDRVIELLRSSLEEIGIDPKTGEFDVDMIEVGSSKTERDVLKNLKATISTLAEEHDQRAAPIEMVADRAARFGIDSSEFEHYIEKLRMNGEVYEPFSGYLRVT